MALRIVLDQFPEPHHLEDASDARFATDRMNLALERKPATASSNYQTDVRLRSFGCPPIESRHGIEAYLLGTSPWCNTIGSSYEIEEQQGYQKSDLDTGLWIDADPTEFVNKGFLSRSSNKPLCLDDILDKRCTLQTSRKFRETLWNEAGRHRRQAWKRQQANSIPSRGSLNHARRMCRPCWRVQAGLDCPRGVLCNYCHYPHPETDNNGQTPYPSGVAASITTLVNDSNDRPWVQTPIP